MFLKKFALALLAVGALAALVPAARATPIIYVTSVAGPGTVDATGGVVTNSVPGSNCNDKDQCRFGDFSSVSVDPGVAGCAFATQQYFATDGKWKTRITPIGQCENIVVNAPTR